jgi:hypothetical protein
LEAYHADPLDGRHCTLEQCQDALDLLEQRIQQTRE